MKPWKRIEPTVVSNIGWRTVVTKTFKMPDGTIKHWQTIGPEDGQIVQTLALTPKNEVVIARQFRVGPEKAMDELPGGLVDSGEELEAAARRELLEETGYQAGSIVLLGKNTCSAYSNETRNYFLARNCVPHPQGQNLEENEFIEVHLISIGQLLASARNGFVTDVTGIFLAYETLKQINKGE